MFKQEIMFNSIYKMSFTIVCIYIYYPYKASKVAGKTHDFAHFKFDFE